MSGTKLAAACIVSLSATAAFFAGVGLAAAPPVGQLPAGPSSAIVTDAENSSPSPSRTAPADASGALPRLRTRRSYEKSPRPMLETRSFRLQGTG
jgi:hypothetical protein